MIECNLRSRLPDGIGTRVLLTLLIGGVAEHNPRPVGLDLHAYRRTNYESQRPPPSRAARTRTS